MKSIPSYALLIYSSLIFILCCILNLWIYHKVQSPDGNIFFFFALPVGVLFYIIQNNIMAYLHQQKNYSYPTYAFALLKCAELSFYVSLSAFVLMSYFWIFLIGLCQLLCLIFALYFQKDAPQKSLFFMPHYDLVLLSILATLIPYIPQLNQAHPKLTIQMIDFICNGVLILNFIILSLNAKTAFYPTQKVATQN